MDVSDLLQLVEQNLRINRRASARTFLPQVKHLLQYLNGIPIEDIGFLMIEDYKDKRLAEKAAPKTINHEIGYLVRGFRLARKAGLIDRIPEFEKLPVTNIRTGFVNEEQMEQIVEKIGPYLKDYVRFAFHTGWRRSEISRLEWAEVDLKEAWIELKPENAKNRSGRRFPLCGKIQEIVDRQQKVRRGAYVFHQKHSRRPINRICNQFRMAALEAGLGHIRLHDMRRSFVRNAVRAGVQIKTAMELSGHKTMSIFFRYNIIDEDDLIDAVTKMDRRHHSS
jgi:integrase